MGYGQGIQLVSNSGGMEVKVEYDKEKLFEWFREFVKVNRWEEAFAAEGMDAFGYGAFATFLRLQFPYLQENALDLYATMVNLTSECGKYRYNERGVGVKRLYLKPVLEVG